MTDWSGFWPSMIATFAGFVLALIGERLYDYYKDLREGNELVKAFNREIQTILSEVKKVRDNGNSVWINPIKIPIWDSVISTNKISLLCNYNWYSDLFRLYNEIKDYNEWHFIRTQQHYSGGDVTAISHALIDSENDIIKYIEKLKKDMI